MQPITTDTSTAATGQKPTKSARRAKATDWQAQSIRGFLSATVGKRMGLEQAFNSLSMLNAKPVKRTLQASAIRTGRLLTTLLMMEASQGAHWSALPYRACWRPPCKVVNLLNSPWTAF